MVRVSFNHSFIITEMILYVSQFNRHNKNANRINIYAHYMQLLNARWLAITFSLLLMTEHHKIVSTGDKTQ